MVRMRGRKREVMYSVSPEVSFVDDVFVDCERVERQPLETQSRVACRL